MYLADYHVHSTCSPDGHQTMAQAAEAAVRQGLRELCITDHVDTIHWGTLAPRDDFDWEESRRQFHEAQALWGDRITLRRGAELGEAQLSFDRADRLLAGEELDFVIGSVHLSGKKFANMDLYYIEKGSEAYYDSVIDSYLDDVLALARWGRFQVLGHLTLPLRYINEHHGEHMTFRRHMDRVEEIFRASFPRGWASSATPTGETSPCRGRKFCGCTAVWAARSSPWAATPTGRRTWAASSGSARSFCGPAASAISPHLNGAGRSFRPCEHPRGERIMKIAIGCDHGGYLLKQDILIWLEEHDIDFEDVGCFSTESVDYPIYGEKVARLVASGACEKGIVICTTGIGISIAANKVKGIRCAHCTDSLSAEMTRRHNDANVLALGAGITGPNLAKRIVEVFLNTGFEGGRHARRVGQLDSIQP